MVDFPAEQEARMAKERAKVRCVVRGHATMGMPEVSGSHGASVCRELERKQRDAEQQAIKQKKAEAELR